MERLYQTSRRTLLLESSSEPGSLITSLIQEHYALHAVQLFDDRSGKTSRAAYARPAPASAPGMRIFWGKTTTIGIRKVGIASFAQAGVPWAGWRSSAQK